MNRQLINLPDNRVLDMNEWSLNTRKNTEFY